MKNACTDTLDLFGDIPSPAGPRKPVDPKASPISYHRNDEEVLSRPERDLNAEEWKAMKILMAYGISNVWSAHFVLFEGVRSIEQFLAFVPNEQWGADTLFRLNKRKAMVKANYKRPQCPQQTDARHIKVWK